MSQTRPTLSPVTVILPAFNEEGAVVFARTTVRSWSLLLQPTLSTSAILLLLLGFQLLLVGMVADGVLRRIAQRNRLAAPSHAVWVREAKAPAQPGEVELPR